MTIKAARPATTLTLIAAAAALLLLLGAFLEMPHPGSPAAQQGEALANNSTGG